MRSDKPIYLPITNIVSENSKTQTFYFKHPLDSQPGQFVMLWIPGIDQKPFSIAFDDGKFFALTIFRRGGPLTSKLFDLKIGDCVGISGPYGTSFTHEPNRHYLLVGGGYGVAPLASLAENLSQNDNKIDFFIGARDAENILFEKRLKICNNISLHIATDDGSAGQKGYRSEEHTS